MSTDPSESRAAGVRSDPQPQGTAPWPLAHRQRWARRKPAALDIFGDTCLAVSAVFGPRWWTVIVVTVLLVGGAVADRLIYWQRTYIETLTDESVAKGDHR